MNSVDRPAPVAVLGRERETELLEAALASGANVVLEGPPGTGKTTLLRTVASHRHTSFVLVEGNAELTPARLLGHFDPALVLERGYDPEVFVEGPLLHAMQAGGLLYVEELNRVPEETLNTLLAAMSEREIAVPRLGTIIAADGFGVVAAMNPYDAVGTARVSGAVYDRTCRIVMDYQPAEAEQQVLAMRVPTTDPGWGARVIDLVRATRSHPDLRVGSSVRGAIDLAGMTAQLAAVRGVSADDWQTGLDAAHVALSGRVRVEESSRRSSEQVIEELYRKIFGDPPHDSSDDSDAPDSREAPGEP